MAVKSKIVDIFTIWPVLNHWQISDTDVITKFIDNSLVWLFAVLPDNSRQLYHMATTPKKVDNFTTWLFVKHWQFYHSAFFQKKSLTNLWYGCVGKKSLTKVSYGHEPWEKCKNFSWQLYCMAVTIIDKFLVWLCTSKFHWQLYCTASKIIDNLDIQLFAPLTIVLYGCQYQLTIVRDGHEPQSWQNYCKSLTKVL